MVLGTVTGVVVVPELTFSETDSRLFTFTPALGTVETTVPFFSADETGFTELTKRSALRSVFSAVEVDRPTTSGINVTPGFPATRK